MKKFGMKFGGFAAVAALLLAACSERDGLRDGEPGTEPTTQTALSLERPKGAENLRYVLYRFCREGTQGEYLLQDSVAPLAPQTKLAFMRSELHASDYRFLFVAQPADGAEVRATGPAGEPLRPGMAWAEVRMRPARGTLTPEVYCGVTEMSGQEIMDRGLIEGTLTRMVGGAALALYRIGAGGIGDPTGVLSPSVGSVLDRVVSVRLEYGGLTQSIRFGEGGALLPDETGGTAVQELAPQLTDGFRVELPQPEAGLSAYDPAAAGSARVEGLYLLPSSGGVRIKAVFTYYDTTPMCANAHPGAHSADCFEQKEITLYLPAADAARGLDVRRDSITLCKGGIRCDRIIDVGQAGNMDIVTDWD